MNKLNVNSIKGLMAYNGHSQKLVSEYLGIDASSVSCKLNGKRRFSVAELKAISELYCVPMDYFFTDGLAEITSLEGSNNG